MISDAYIRDDIPGFVMPTVNYNGGLIKKDNYNALGPWALNN